MQTQLQHACSCVCMLSHAVCCRMLSACVTYAGVCLRQHLCMLSHACCVLSHAACMRDVCWRMLKAASMHALACMLCALACCLHASCILVRLIGRFTYQDMNAFIEIHTHRVYLCVQTEWTAGSATTPPSSSPLSGPPYK